jgi:hypothetical protein
LYTQERTDFTYNDGLISKWLSHKNEPTLETIEYSYLKGKLVSVFLGNYKIKYMHNADKTVFENLPSVQEMLS